MTDRRNRGAKATARLFAFHYDDSACDNHGWLRTGCDSVINGCGARIQ